MTTISNTVSASATAEPLHDAVNSHWASWQLWALALLLLGMAWRLLRYSLQFPIWGDEAYVCLNFLGQNCTGLLDGLQGAVVAPILFMWGELVLFQWLGGGELALRLLPVVAGLAALPLFWRLARRLLDPAAAALAAGLLAVSYYPVRHAVEVKPYSLDLLVAVVLLSLAVEWLRQPGRLLWPVLLCLFLPIALGLSHPAVFVSGGIGLTLMPALWRQPARAKTLWAAYNLVLVLTFLGYLTLNMRLQPESSLQFLDAHWGHAFPPREPFSLLIWLLETHTGNMMAYPAGGKHGASTLTFLLFLGGVWHFARLRAEKGVGSLLCAAPGGRFPQKTPDPFFRPLRRWDVLGLCLAPFALTFVAAWLHRYPYGDSARLCQHLAPAICLLAGAGLVTFLAHACRTVQARRFGHAAVCGLLVVASLIGMGLDLWKPFKTQGSQQCRLISQEILAQAGPDCMIVVCNEWAETQSDFLWYLFANHPHTSWQKDVDWAALSRRDRVLCVRFSPNTPYPQPPQLPLAWRLAHRDLRERPLDISGENTTEFIEVADFRQP